MNGVASLGIALEGLMGHHNGRCWRHRLAGEGSDDWPTKLVHTVIVLPIRAVREQMVQRISTGFQVVLTFGGTCDR